MTLDVSQLLLAADLSLQEVEEILAPYGFLNPHEVDRLLQRMCPDTTSRFALAAHLDSVLNAASQSANPEVCLLQLDRLAESHGQRSTLYHRLGADPQTLNTFFSLASCSRVLSDVLVLNPEYVTILADSQMLTMPRDLDDLRLEASGLTRIFHEKEAALGALRRMRRREYLRIGARELTGIGSLQEIVGEISDLACAIVGETLSVCYEYQDYPGEEKPPSFAVVAFGKLGAGELNYSSDIDLAIVWETPPGEESEDISRFYSRLAKSLVDALANNSPDGRLYRVDLRLRPFGNAGPIGSSVTQFLNYYESYSEPWERQALLKARTIAGPPALRARLDDFIQRFIYARTMDPFSIAQILEVKNRSEEFRSRGGQMDRQVKHGWGGIRDVEFTVQLLQLVAGYQNPEVRTPATLDALEALRTLGVLSSQEQIALESAYIFLRQVEHRLQLAEELPMQTIPEDQDKLRVLAMGMGFRDEPSASAAQQFLQEYSDITHSVRSIHLRLFRDFMEQTPDESVVLSRILELGTDEEGFLARYGFSDAPEIARRLSLIVSGKDKRPISSEPQRRFLQNLPDLLNSVSHSADPDKSIIRLQQMAEATGSPLSFFRSISGSEKGLNTFTRLAGASNFLTQALVRHPEYIDMLADAGSLSRTRTLGGLVRDLTERVKREEGEEERLNALRRFRLREFLRIGVRDVSGMATTATVNREISLLAEACIRVAYWMTCGAGGALQKLPGDLAAIGFGKLGGRELHYSSDVDLVFVSRQTRDVPDAFRLFERGVKAVLDALGRLTSEGRGFEVDLRLRPEGKGGMLAYPIEGYQRYLRENAKAWERQALVRSRYVAGSKGLADMLMQDIREAVWGRPLTSEDLDGLRHIKRRIETEKSTQSGGAIDIKRGDGGILDVEFTVQILQLAWGATVPDLNQPNTYQAIRALRDARILPASEAEILLRAYGFLRKCENRLQIAEESAQDTISREPAALGSFARRLGYAYKKPETAAEKFLGDLESHTTRVRAIHERVYFELDLSRDAWQTPVQSLA